ncbi:hypothetical protein [Streptomyces griseomycini]|uniref:Helix-turn-helix domain-containing protein n=1 Tax=Streptomyces griseomycini TaxID=66895 RepID=A0A7W7PWD4_9ACTN|nr:hypothetical protein [Streptomyces griseomycini]MBB4902493.1 hypothetical protein [Streptomyces griseomycini]GGR52032.1 hypothetical protein GCM10015536_66850 [Streptomyces griseomycini]
MNRSSEAGGLRHNPSRPPYVIVDSKTVRDTRISYRALALLVFLLDQAEGWQVRSDQLSKGEGREGRAAVRTALRELAVHGYYRLERRRLRNGKCVMGTAISRTPIEQWVRDHEIFSTQRDPAVPVVEQEDGTFLVEYPDGTFGSDGFAPDPRDEEEPPADPGPEPEPAEEQPAAPPKKPARTRRPRRTPEEKAAADAEKAAAAEKKAAEKAALDEGATAGAQWWWGTAAKNGQPAKKGRVDELADAGVIPRYVGNRSRAYHGVRNLVRNALAAGYDRGTVAQALEDTKRAFPSQQQFEDACAAAAGVHIDRPRFGSSRPPAYSDTANWGDQNSGTPTTSSTPDEPDEVTFGVIERP